MSTPETPTSQGRTPRRALTRRSFLVGLTGTGVAFGLLAACAPTPPAAPTSAPAAPAKPAESKPAAPAAPAVQPVSNAKPPTLVHNSGSDPTTLDPHFGESSV